MIDLAGGVKRPSIEVVIDDWNFLHFVIYSHWKEAENWRELEPEARAVVLPQMLDHFEQWWLQARSEEGVSTPPSIWFPCPDELAAKAVFPSGDEVIIAVEGHYVVASSQGLASNWRELEPEARVCVLTVMVACWKRCWSNGQKGSRELLRKVFDCPSGLAKSAVFDIKRYWTEPRAVQYPFVQISDLGQPLLETAERVRRHHYRLEKEEEED